MSDATLWTGIRVKHIIAGIAESIEKQAGERKAERTIYAYIQISKELPKEIKEKIAVEPQRRAAPHQFSLP